MTAPESESQLPNFFILGAPKCGTTSLYRYLGSHPDVFFPANKEPQFFCNEGLFSRGLGFYARTFFAGADRFVCRGDATPHYLYYEKVAVRIRQSLPAEHHRFIVILRDPVERAYSHYWNMVAEGLETASFEKALALEAERLTDPELERAGTLTFHYVSAGLYATQLERYFRHLNRDRFLILFQEDLATNPSDVLQQVLDFLGLPARELDLLDRYNEAGMPRSTRLQQMMRSPNRLQHALGRIVPYRLKFRVVDGIRQLNRREFRYPMLDPRVADTVRARFMDDIMRLETLTGRDLTRWKTARSA
jgi:hypothetical protein